MDTVAGVPGHTPSYKGPEGVCDIFSFRGLLLPSIPFLADGICDTNEWPVVANIYKDKSCWIAINFFVKCYVMSIFFLFEAKYRNHLKFSFVFIRYSSTFWIFQT